MIHKITKSKGLIEILKDGEYTFVNEANIKELYFMLNRLEDRINQLIEIENKRSEEQ